MIIWILLTFIDYYYHKSGIDPIFIIYNHIKSQLVLSFSPHVLQKMFLDLIHLLFVLGQQKALVVHRQGQDHHTWQRRHKWKTHGIWWNISKKNARILEHAGKLWNIWKNHRTIMEYNFIPARRINIQYFKSF